MWNSPAISSPYNTLTGVSQGSNLGPLEFVIFINDLPDVIQNARCLLFADDLKLFLAIKDPADSRLLQSDIDRALEWSYKNNLFFNTSKCAIMTCSRAQEPINYEYELDGLSLTRVTSMRDLGVVMQSDLKFTKHISDTCAKAFRNLGFVLRETKDLQRTVAACALYNALVRSKLETGAMVWNPYEAKYVSMVEKIQNKFTRFLYLKRYGIYPFFPLMYPTLFVLGMVGYHKLEVRRNLSLAKYVFQVFRGTLNNPEILESLKIVVPNTGLRRGPRPQVLEVPWSRTNLLKFSPVSMAIRVLNKVSEQVDLFSCSLSEFVIVALDYLSRG